jgi:hypothetical protein
MKKPELLFSTPLWRIDLEHDPAALHAYCRDLENSVSKDFSFVEKPAASCRNGGIQSARRDLRYTYLFSFLFPGIVSCLEGIRPAILAQPLMGWANRNPVGAFNHAHVHPRALLSAVIYLQVPEGSGNIVFLDPRPQSQYGGTHVRWGPSSESQTGREIARDCFQPKHFVMPKSGELILFPGWLHHYVDVNESPRARLSVAFNIM